MADKKINYELSSTDKFTPNFLKLKEHIQGVGTSFGDMQTKFLAFGAGAVTVGAFAHLVKSMLDLADSTGKNSQKAGMATEEFSKMAYAAGLSDVSVQTLTKGVKGLSDMMVKATDATSHQAAIMRALGVDVGGSVNDAMLKVADTFKTLPDGATKTALAVALFGKAGQEMIPMLNAGSDGMKKMQDEAVKFGLVIGDDTAKAAERLNDNLKTLGMTGQGLAIRLVNEFAPGLAKVTDAMKEAYLEGGKLHSLWIGFGGLMSMIFTDHDLAPLQKVNKEINSLMKEVGDITAAQAEKPGLIESILGNQDDALATRMNVVTQKLSELRVQRTALMGVDTEAQRVAALWKKYYEDEGKALEKTTRNMLAAGDAREKNAAADRAAKKALDEWVKAAMDALAMDEAMAKGITDLEDKRTASILSTEKNIAQIEFETSLIGLSNAERQTAIALRAIETSGITKQDSAYEELARRMTAAIAAQESVREGQEAMQRQSAMWDSMSSAAGNFFADLAMNGRSAFDNLRQSLKSLAQDLLAFFAKRWVLQMIAGSAGTFGATAASAANASLGTMGNSLMGTGLSAASSYLFGTAGTYASTGMAMGAMGGVAETAGTAGLLGSGGAGAALMTALPYIAIAGIVAIAYKKFFDEGDAQRSGMFGATSAINGGATPGYSYTGGLGTFGIGDTHWFGDDQATQIKAFIAGMKGLDDGLAQYLTTDELTRVKASLTDAKSYGFGLEHTGGDAATFGQIMVDRINAVFAAVDPALSKFLDGFSGTGDELAVFATDLLGVRNALTAGIVPDMTIESLMKLQTAGETLGATFQRVAGEFIGARNALDQAIGARNPQFARDLALSQRNQIAQAFADALGLNFGEELLARMALRPETFSGLNTETMNLLANFLGLQTTLEGLDGKLGTLDGSVGSLSNSVNDFASIVLNAGEQIGQGSGYIAPNPGLSGAQTGLADYLRGALLSDNSPLDPMAKYRESQSQYQSLLTLAQGGNLDAMAGLGASRDAFLQFSRLVNASNGQYNTDFFGSYNQVAALTGGQIRPYTAADAKANTQALLVELKASQDKQVQTTQAIAALAAVVIEIAQTGDPVLRAKAQEQVDALNKIANRGGALSGSF